MSDFLWHRDGVVYQIYPRSFSDANGDGFGDLPGITSRLDYLSDLGVDAIWLSPIYPTPDADFGYDVADHAAVDPRFGTVNDFDTLVTEAHGRGIRVILDLVLNHTSDLHPWFIQSRAGRDNPRRDWYIWENPGQGGRPPNNWRAAFGGRAWTFDAATGQYYLHLFLPQQPDLNWRNPEVRKAQLDVVRFWLERGVDGFRLDIFNAYFKDAGLRDNPYGLWPFGFDRQRHLHDRDQPELIPFLQELRSLLDSYPERYAVGETFGGGASRASGYVGDRLLHAAFSFDFTAAKLFFPWNPGWILGRLMSREAFFTEGRWPTTVMSNHDLPRAAGRYGRGEGDARAKLAMAVLLTARGTPFLYYGEEIGMRDLRLRRDEIVDPPGMRYWPLYKGRDGCRGPMQWEAGAHAGFSAVKPWLPVHPDWRRRNVASQRLDPDSMLLFTRKLISLRKEYPELCRGSFVPYECRGGVLAYLRSTEGRSMLVALNFRNRKSSLTLETEPAGYRWERVFSTARRGAGRLPRRLVLEPFEVCLLRLTSITLNT